MRIGVFTDLHANLPALKKAIMTFHAHHCTHIIHVGDLIGIGPFPEECLELALATDHMDFIMGNHDYWYAHGLPDPLPGYMHPDEVSHQRWVHKQIGVIHQNRVQQWPFLLSLDTPSGQQITFVHYALNNEKNWFRSFVKNPEGLAIERLFVDTKGDIIFYGHQHIAHDHHGDRRYVNLGSAGCYNQPIVRLAIVECNTESTKINKMSMEYEDDGLMEAFDERNVPAKSFIRKVFITR